MCRLPLLRLLLRQVLLLSAREAGPLRREHWLGTVDARPLALFRIAFGAVVLADALDRFVDLRAFYTDAGMLPRAALHELMHGWGRSPLVALVGSPWAAALLLGVGAAAALALAFGLAARAATVVVWLYLLTIVGRNGFILDGGDLVMLALAFFALFADVAAVWSLRRGPPRPRVPALPVRLLELQVALIYLASGLDKHGPLWRRGEALYHVLQGNDYARPLGMALGSSPSLCALLTFATLAIELAFAPLVLSPLRNGAARAIAATSAAALHLGIYALMRVGMFSFVMLAALCLFVPPSLCRRIRAVADGAPPSRWPPALTPPLLALFALVALHALAPRWTPQPLARLLGRLGVQERWTMFAPDPPCVDGYWAATARRRDGATVDPLRELAPKMLPQRSLRYSRWFRLRDAAADDPTLQMLLLQWFCRREPALEEATLWYWRRPTHAPGAPPERFSLSSDRSWRCRR